MPPAEVIFHRLAAQEYQKACQWYAEKHERARQSFVEEIDRATLRIASRPESGTRFGRR